MLSFNATFVLVFVSMVLFMLAMRGLFFEPLRRLKAEREQAIARDRSLAASNQSEADRIHGEYADRLALVLAQSQAVLKEKTQDARVSSAELIQKTRQDNLAKMQESSELMLKSRQVVLNQLLAEQPAEQFKIRQALVSQLKAMVINGQGASTVVSQKEVALTAHG